VCQRVFFRRGRRIRILSESGLISLVSGRKKALTAVGCPPNVRGFLRMEFKGITVKTDPVETDIGPETPEFSRLVSIEDLRSGEIERRIGADDAECAALAERFGVTALRNFSALFVTIRKGRSSLVRLKGHLTAEVEQTCIVTLEPVVERVDEAFDLRFTLNPDKKTGSSDVVFDPEAEDPPEAAGPNGIDAGEAVAQQLSIAINPYPRAPGADMRNEAAAAAKKSKVLLIDDETSDSGALNDLNDEKAAGANPFAILGTLKRGK